MSEYNAPELVEIGDAAAVVLGEKTGTPPDTEPPVGFSDLTILDNDE